MLNINLTIGFLREERAYSIVLARRTIQKENKRHELYRSYSIV